MKNYKLIANNEQSHESTELGIIRAHSIQEAALFLAYNFPDQYYSANIVEVGVEHPSFLAIACSDYYAYENDGVLPNPVDAALNRLMIEMKCDNEMFDRISDYAAHDAEITYQVWKDITSCDGRIVKQSTEEM